MKFLFLDLETTGLDTSKDRITEICCALWDSKSGQILRLYNSLVKAPDLLPGYISDDLVEITGITNDMVQDHGVWTFWMFQELETIFRLSDYVVAHNGNMFDKPLFLSEFQRCLPQIISPGQFQKHWIDTTLDVPYPDTIKTRKLTHLAAEHGFVNPFPHRAFSDVMTMIKIFEQYDSEEIVKLSMTPNIRVTMSPQNSFHNKDKAKAAGFRWDANSKLWTLIAKADQLEIIRGTFEFDTTEEFL